MDGYRYFTGEYYRYYNEFYNETDIDSEATNFFSDVELLSKEFENIKNVIVNWSGEGAIAMSNSAINSIITKFDTTMENINNALVPASENVKLLLEQLELMKDKETLLIELETKLENEREKNISKKISDGVDASGNTIYVNNPKYDSWISNINSLDGQVKELISELEEVKLKCDEYIKIISELEASILEFTDYLSIASTVLGLNGESADFASMTLDERLAYIDNLMSNYQEVLKELNAKFQEMYGNGLSFSGSDFKKLDTLFDCFDIYWKAGVSREDFSNALSGNGSVFLKIDSLIKIMNYCDDNDVFTKINSYLNGKSWEESGIASLYDGDFFGYNEKKFRDRVRKNYGVDNPIDYLKKSCGNFLEIYNNLQTARSDYNAMVESISLVKSKISQMEYAKKLMPFEYEMNNPLFASYLSKDYFSYSLLSQEKLQYMSQQEVALYDFLYHNKSKEEAEAYLKVMEDAINQRIGAYKAAEYVSWICQDGFQVSDLMKGGFEGFKDGTRNFVDGLADLFRVDSTEVGTKSALDYELMYKSMFMLEVSEDTQNISQDMRELINQFYNTGTSVGNMAIPMLAGFVPVVGKPLSSALMGLSIAGNSAVEARQNGATTAQAYLYGVASGVSEATTERLLGGIPGVSNLGKSFLGNMVSEGLEEFTQTYMDAGLRNVILGEDNNLLSKELLSEAFESGKQGMITSGVLQGGNTVIGSTLNTTTSLLTNGKISSYSEFVNTVESNFYRPRAEAAINTSLETLSTGGSLSLGESVNLNRAINNVSVEELSSITRNLSAEQQSSLQTALKDNLSILSNNSVEKINDVNTFREVSTSTNINSIEDISSKLQIEVTRDGRTMEQYLQSRNTSVVTDSSVVQNNSVSNDVSSNVVVNTAMNTSTNAVSNTVTNTQTNISTNTATNATSNTVVSPAASQTVETQSNFNAGENVRSEVTNNSFTEVAVVTNQQSGNVGEVISGSVTPTLVSSEQIANQSNSSVNALDNSLELAPPPSVGVQNTLGAANIATNYQPKVSPRVDVNGVKSAGTVGAIGLGGMMLGRGFATNNASTQTDVSRQGATIASQTRKASSAGTTTTDGRINNQQRVNEALPIFGTNPYAMGYNAHANVVANGVYSPNVILNNTARSIRTDYSSMELKTLRDLEYIMSKIHGENGNYTLIDSIEDFKKQILLNRKTKFSNVNRVLERYPQQKIIEFCDTLIAMENVSKSVESKVKTAIAAFNLRHAQDGEYLLGEKYVQRVIDTKDFRYMTRKLDARAILETCSFEDMQLALNKIILQNRLNSIDVSGASRTTSRFFDRTGSIENDNYGVDQGAIYNMFEFIDERTNKKYDYKTAKMIYNESVKRNNVIRKFEKVCSAEYFALKAKIVNKYPGLTENEASIILSCIDDVGACTYAAFANQIFNSFRNDAKGFESVFGFPMYRTNNGVRVLNSEELLVDLYMFGNSKENGGKFIVKDRNGYHLDRSMISKTADPLGRYLLKTYEQTYYSSRQNMREKYLRSKGIYYSQNMFYGEQFNSKTSFEYDIINRVVNGIKNGKGYDISIHSYSRTINMLAPDNVKSYSNDSTDRFNGGGHAMFITDVIDKGFVVSSWGHKYLIPFNDLVNSNGWRLTEVAMSSNPMAIGSTYAPSNYYGGVELATSVDSSSTVSDIDYIEQMEKDTSTSFDADDSKRTEFLINVDSIADQNIGYYTVRHPDLVERVTELCESFKTQFIEFGSIENVVNNLDSFHPWQIDTLLLDADNPYIIELFENPKVMDYVSKNMSKSKILKYARVLNNNSFITSTFLELTPEEISDIGSFSVFQYFSSFPLDVQKQFIRANKDFFKKELSSFLFKKFDDQIVLSVFDEILDFNGFSNLGWQFDSLTPEVQKALFDEFSADIYKLPQNKFIELVGRLSDGNYQAQFIKNSPFYAEIVNSTSFSTLLSKIKSKDFVLELLNNPDARSKMISSSSSFNNIISMLTKEEQMAFIDDAKNSILSINNSNDSFFAADNVYSYISAFSSDIQMQLLNDLDIVQSMPVSIMLKLNNSFNGIYLDQIKAKISGPFNADSAKIMFDSAIYQLMDQNAINSAALALSPYDYGKLIELGNIEAINAVIDKNVVNRFHDLYADVITKMFNAVDDTGKAKILNNLSFGKLADVIDYSKNDIFVDAFINELNKQTSGISQSSLYTIARFTPEIYMKIYPHLSNNQKLATFNYDTATSLGLTEEYISFFRANPSVINYMNNYVSKNTINFLKLLTTSKDIDLYYSNLSLSSIFNASSLSLPSELDLNRVKSLLMNNLSTYGFRYLGEFSGLANALVNYSLQEQMELLNLLKLEDKYFMLLNGNIKNVETRLEVLKSMMSDSNFRESISSGNMDSFKKFFDNLEPELVDYILQNADNNFLGFMLTIAKRNDLNIKFGNMIDDNALVLNNFEYSDAELIWGNLSVENKTLLETKINEMISSIGNAKIDSLLQSATIVQKSSFLAAYNDGLITNEKIDLLLKLQEKNRFVLSTFNYALFDDTIYKFGENLLTKLSKYYDVVNQIVKLKNNPQKFNLFANLIINDSTSSSALVSDQKMAMLLNYMLENDIDPVLLSPSNNIELETARNIILKQIDQFSILDGNMRDIVRERSIIVPDSYTLSDYYDKLAEKCDSLMQEATDVSVAQNLIFNKYFSMSIEDAKEMFRMYGSRFSETTKFDSDGVATLSLEIMQNILDMTTLEEVKTFYDSLNSINRYDMNAVLNIIHSIKKVYTKSLKNTLFSPTDITGYVEYNGKQIPVYEPQGNFQMLIQSTYTDYGGMPIINDSYFDSWNLSSRTANHGICCSLISNNNMGMAAVKGPGVVIGFNSFSDEQINMMAPYDIYTRNDGYVIKCQRPLLYLPGEEVMNETRHTHNEFNLERTNLTGEGTLANIQPDYVVVFEEMMEEQKQNAYKASLDFSVPLVYINKTALAERESAKIDGLISDYKATGNVQLLNDILVLHENNRSGYRNPTDSKILDKYFNVERINDVLSSAVSQNNNAEELQYIKDFLLFEREKFDVTNEATHRVNVIDINVNELILQIDTKLSSMNI